MPGNKKAEIPEPTAEIRLTRKHSEKLKTALREYRRLYEREKIEHVPVRVRVFDKDDEIINRGYGVLKNISPSGALLVDLHFEYADRPRKAFQMAFRILGGEFSGMEVLCKPIHEAGAPPENDKGGLALGVKFQHVYIRMAA